MPTSYPTYDVTQSYEWNYDNGPIKAFDIPAMPAARAPRDFLGFRVNSPLGIPAGPLLNATFIELYARLGWDIPVYKTVRSSAKACHPNPNIVFVHPDRQLAARDVGGTLIGDTTEPVSPTDISITNSFGVPSQSPDVWMRDVELANRAMQDGQVMIVSVMGTANEKEAVEVDYARAAAMAVEAGAKIIEANYSCPNLCSGEGQIFGDAALSSRISKEIRAAIGTTPFLIKMGTLASKADLKAVVEANAPFVDGFAGVNTLQMAVVDSAGEQALPGNGRLKSGICGTCIRDIGQMWTRDVIDIRTELGRDFVIVGVGGVMTEADIDDRMNAGADIVMSATAAMWDPFLAKRWREMTSSSTN